MTVPQGSPPRSDAHDAAEATELQAISNQNRTKGRLTKNKKRGNFLLQEYFRRGNYFYNSFILIQKNRRRVKLQTSQFYINSKTIELQRVKTVIILGKMVYRRSGQASQRSRCACTLPPTRTNAAPRWTEARPRSTFVLLTARGCVTWACWPVSSYKQEKQSHGANRMMQNMQRPRTPRLKTKTHKDSTSRDPLTKYSQSQYARSSHTFFPNDDDDD